MKTLFTTLIAFGVLAFGATASAITINDGGIYHNTIVGDVDFFLAADEKVGNETEETIWVNNFLSPNDTVTYEVKSENVPYYSTDGTNIFAFSLMNSDPRPDYFLIKNATYMALFENIAYVGWGVFDITDIKIENEAGVLESIKINLGNELEGDGDVWQISHVTEFVSTGDRGLCNPNLDPTCISAVPIPASIWLITSGLIGLVAVGRRRKV